MTSKIKQSQLNILQHFFGISMNAINISSGQEPLTTRYEGLCSLFYVCFDDRRKTFLHLYRPTCLARPFNGHFQSRLSQYLSGDWCKVITQYTFKYNAGCVTSDVKSSWPEVWDRVVPVLVCPSSCSSCRSPSARRRTRTRCIPRTSDAASQHQCPRRHDADSQTTCHSTDITNHSNDQNIAVRNTPHRYGNSSTHVPYSHIARKLSSNSVTCHPAKVTFPPLPQSIKAGTRYSNPWWMQNWVYLVGWLYTDVVNRRPEY